jgi:predicted RNA-binding Zn-ribbon protein involved in translation (DUF1610 family)
VAKRAIATNWEVITCDDEGAMVNIDFVCPCCGYTTGVFIFVGASGVGCLDGGWETDQICPVCDEDIIIKCH